MVYRDKMVFAEIGRSVCADAVLLNPHPVDVETANYRAAGRAWRKRRSGDARVFEQQVAKSRSAVPAQFVVWHHGDCRKLVSDYRDCSDQSLCGRRGPRLRWSRLGGWLSGRGTYRRPASDWAGYRDINLRQGGLGAWLG